MVIVNDKKKSLDTPAFLNESKQLLEKKKTTTVKKVKPSFAKIAPVIDVTINGFLEMRSGEFLEIFQITSKDIYSLNESDLENDINSLSNFMISYSDDIKFIPLNIPLNLEQQKRHIQKKIKENKNPRYLPYLQNRLREFENLEKHRSDREYFLFFYDNDELKLKQKVQQIRNLLSRSNPAIVLSVEKKKHILFQMCNPNTKAMS